MQALAGGDPTVGRKLKTMEEDKRQLSPVSVLDFPFDDDDGDEEERSDAGTCSPSFLLQRHDCSANLQGKLLLPGRLGLSHYCFYSYYCYNKT
jgi:hypothetical protein